MPALGSLTLGSTTYDVMGVKSSGYQEQNQLVVAALDDQGKPYPDGLTVKFDHISIGGSTLSLVLAPAPAACTSVPGACTVNAPTASPLGLPDSTGLASAWLTSGTIASPYQVVATATAGGVTRSFTLPTLYSVGAKASGLDFAVDCSPRNVPALAETDCGTSFVDATITCVARLKDRFGNLLGVETPVMFKSEASGYGYVQTTPQFDPTKQSLLGSAVEIFRTHLDGLPVDVAPQAGEPSVTHNVDHCGVRVHNPRDGVVTIMALADGEEAFTDLNGNGKYDLGEPFVDLGEPFVDANDNGVWDSGEYFYDANGNGAYDGPNGVWDAKTKIWTQTVVVYTGAATGPLAVTAPGTGYLGTRWIDPAAYTGACASTPAAPAAFSVAAKQAGPPIVNPDSKDYYVQASDLNLNFLSTDTSYAAAVLVPGKVVATYQGSAKYADDLGFKYIYWPCKGLVCGATETPAGGAWLMKPSVGAFSCGLTETVTITGADAPQGASATQTVEWRPFTTYPLYNQSHISTAAWGFSGLSN